MCRSLAVILLPPVMLSLLLGNCFLLTIADSRKQCSQSAVGECLGEPVCRAEPDLIFVSCQLQPRLFQKIIEDVWTSSASSN